MAVCGRIDVKALASIVVIQVDCITIYFDDANAFKSVCRHRMLFGLAHVIPAETRYAKSPHDYEYPELLFALEGRTTKVVPSARGVHQ